MNPVSVDSVSAYLVSRSTPYKKITELTGGTGNYVFCIEKLDGSLVVLKHAEPFVKSNTSIALPVSRMHFEAQALSIIPNLFSSASLRVAPPILYDHDRMNNVIQTSYDGSRTLKEAYKDQVLDIPVIGSRLGKWLAQLHSSTKAADIGENFVAKDIYRYCYSNVHSSLAKFGLDPQLGHTINKIYGALLKSDDECVCHGDFWTGNILLSDSSADQTDPTLTVVDWELTRRGKGSTDVGQFAAEAWLLDYFRSPNRGLRAAFLSSYLKETEPSREYLKRAAVHFGCHLAFWPTHVVWGDSEQTKAVVKIGADIMEKAHREDWDWLQSSEFLKDVTYR